MGIIFCPLFSGSSGNSIILRTENTSLLIDAGKPGIAIRNGLEELMIDRLDGLVITHEHTDHSKAAGIISRKYDIPIYATRGTLEGMKSVIGKIKPSNLCEIEAGREFELGDIKINPFNIPHDANEPVGYNFYIDNLKLTVATDIGCVTDEVYNNIIDSDVLLLESNHDINMLKFGSYPWPLKQRILGDNGHLSNEMAGNLIKSIYNKKLKHVILGHLSRENNFPELAYKTVRNILEIEGIVVGKDGGLDLTVAKPSQVSKAVVI